MRRIAGLVSVSGLLLFGAIPAVHADAPAQAAGGAIRGVVPAHGKAYLQTSNANLTYHGGAVELGTHHTYAIYWGSSFNSTYKSLINGYFQNVAADSGKTTNVYYSDTQYTNSAGSHITYSESYSGAWSDTALPSSSGCSSTAGGTVKCVSDAQVRQEVAKAIAANGWKTGSTNEFFVFLGNGISTCYSSNSCAFSQFCAYHSNTTVNSANVLYANMPYTGHNLSACGSGNYPNSNSSADSTINVTSHEANESITDSFGTAWYDPSGNEDGDKCAWNFGSYSGNSNQTINGAHYFLQQEWSNHSTGCVLHGI